jgi:hypothetical protein
MNHSSDNEPANLSGDDLRAENEVLKLKLKLEYNMDINQESPLPPADENKWLNYMYEFEKQYKEAKRIKVFERIGRPVFIKANDLKQGEVDKELRRILSLMEEKGIELDCCVDYDNAIIYKFITEELFDHEMDHIEIEGYVQHFIYEEFHPNHDYDLRRYAEQFIDLLLRRKLNEFDAHHFSHKVYFKSSEYDRAGILAIIETFQEAHDSFEVDQFEIQHVNFDVEEAYAVARAAIRYTALGRETNTYEGTATINFTFDGCYWSLSGFQVPGLSDL